MATVPRTIVVPLDAPAQTQEFSLAPGLAQYIQSVYIEVDTSGSGATTPLLSISEQAGVPIAVIPQDTTLDGGGSGRATWALRLAGSGGGGSTITTGLELIVDGTGSTITAGNTGFLRWVHSAGDALLDYSDPFQPTIINAGMYAASMAAEMTAAPGPIANGVVMLFQLSVQNFQVPGGLQSQMPFYNSLGTTNSVSATIVRPVDAGTIIDALAGNYAAGTARFKLYGTLARLS